MTTYVVALQQVPATINGESVMVLAGARLLATDPLVKANPGRFAPVPAAPKRRSKNA
jgi:hypothetical protein